MHSHRFFEHTADLGIELEADSLGELLLAGAAALDEATFGPINRTSPDGPVTTWKTDETDPEWILFAWLKHWLAAFHADERVLVPSRVAAAALPVEHGRISIELRAVEGTAAATREIKAITLHDFQVYSEGGKWHARVIVDI